MIRRPVMAAALMSAAILPFLAAMPLQAAVPRVAFSRAALTPRTVKSGSNVTARVTVNPTGGATVTSVNLRLVRSGSADTTIALSRSGNVWSKTFGSPANYSGKAMSVTVWADAQTSIGVKSYRMGVLKVNTTTIDPNLPPPPPPI